MEESGSEVKYRGKYKVREKLRRDRSFRDDRVGGLARAGYYDDKGTLLCTGSIVEIATKNLPSPRKVISLSSIRCQMYTLTQENQRPEARLIRGRLLLHFHGFRFTADK